MRHQLELKSYTLQLQDIGDGYTKWRRNLGKTFRFYFIIFDDLPDPDYNRDYYESCDWLGCISRQTYGIVSRVGKIDSNTIKPLED